MEDMDESVGVEEEMNISKLQYHLEEYPQLLAKALVPEKGQKALIKKLYNDHSELIEKCSINDLRFAACEGPFLMVPEGRKLVALSVSKIGLKQFWLLAKNVIQKTETDKKICEYYGEIFLSYWKMAKTDEERRGVELVYEDIVRYAITTKLETSEHFRMVLNPLVVARNKQIDGMIERILRPNLWRCLQSVNDLVRYNSCKLFFLFYPVIKDDDLENAEFITTQLASMADLITDCSIPIRAYSCKQALYIFSLFWTVFSKEYRKANFGKIIDKLSRDSSSEVRVAVYEGLQHMVRCAEAVNTVESAVKSLILRGINDTVVKVRLAAFQLLASFRNHRYIKWWNVIELNQVLERLEVEKVDQVKKKIATLLIRRIFTFNASGDEILRRIIYMGNINRVAVVKFHECICRYQLIALDQAVDHIIAMGTTVYKLARSFERSSQQSLASFDVTDITLSSLENIAPLIVDAGKEDDREGARLWRQLCLLVESLTVSWAILREPLSAEQYAPKRAKLSRLLTKLFSHLLHCFKDSSLAEAILVLGSTLRGGSELVQIGNILCKELNCTSKFSPTLVAGYIEALSNWNLEKVIDIVDKGLINMKNEAKNFKQNQKRSKITSQVDSSRVLLFLEIMLRSPIVEQNLVHNYHGFLMKFYFNSEFIKDAISIRLSHESNVCEGLEMLTVSNVVRALEVRQTLALILINISEEDDKQKIMSEVHGDLEWFVEILPNLVATDDQEMMDFLVAVSLAMLRLLSIHLESFAYEKEFLIDVANIALMFCNQKAPHVFIIPVIQLIKNLLLSLVFNGARELLSELIYEPTQTCLIWISARCSDEGFDSKGCAETFLDLLNTLQSHSSLTKELLTDLSKTVIAIVIGALKDKNTECQDVEDPRGLHFEVEMVLKVVVHRILIKNYAFLWTVLDTFKNTVCSGLFTQDLDTDDIIYMYGAQLQFLHLCNLSAAKTSTCATLPVKPCAMSTTERMKLSDLITSCFENIKSSLEKSSESVTSHCIYELLLQLCNEQE